MVLPLRQQHSREKWCSSLLANRHSRRARMMLWGNVLLLVMLTYATVRLQVQISSRNTAIEINQAYTELPSRLTGESNTLKVGVRYPIPANEFFHKSPPSSVLNGYFSFEPPDWERDADRLRLKPTWKCSDDPSERFTKVIFLHLTRSAGSTLRPFFRAYSNLCHRGIAIVSQCVDLGLESMKGGDIWRNGETGPQAAKDCWLSLATNRTGSEILSNPGGFMGRMNTAFLKDHDIDILAGHLSLGSESYWLDSSREQPQYVVFVRHPLAKYVSQILLVERADNLTIQEAVALVNRSAARELEQRSYHDTFSSYLITPQQKEWVDVENVEWTPERRVNLTLSNLFQRPVLVGVVDRFPESLQMLGYVLDKDGEANNLVNFFSSPPNSTKLYEKLGNRNRTLAVVEAIEQDASVSATLREFLRYELEIYEYALELHVKQYQWMQQDRGESSTMKLTQSSRTPR
jgi:hypothetical protein